MVTTGPSDINTVLTKGFSIHWHSEGGTNYPTNYCWVLTMGINELYKQVAFDIGYNIYTRSYYQSRWDNWRETTLTGAVVQ